MKRKFESGEESSGSRSEEEQDEEQGGNREATIQEGIREALRIYNSTGCICYDFGAFLEAYAAAKEATSGGSSDEGSAFQPFHHENLPTPDSVCGKYELIFHAIELDGSSEEDYPIFLNRTSRGFINIGKNTNPETPLLIGGYFYVELGTQDPKQDYRGMILEEGHIRADLAYAVDEDDPEHPIIVDMIHAEPADESENSDEESEEEGEGRFGLDAIGKIRFFSMQVDLAWEPNEGEYTDEEVEAISERPRYGDYWLCSDQHFTVPLDERSTRRIFEFVNPRHVFEPVFSFLPGDLYLKVGNNFVVGRRKPKVRVKCDVRLPMRKLGRMLSFDKQVASTSQNNDARFDHVFLPRHIARK